MPDKLVSRLVHVDPDGGVSETVVEGMAKQESNLSQGESQSRSKDVQGNQMVRGQSESVPIEPSGTKPPTST